MTCGNPKTLSIEGAAARLGFSPRHVRRLVEAGELEASQPSGVPGCSVAASAVADFEGRRSAAERRADEFSGVLDDAGAPPE
jgi:excisionase family DNA binding protein